MRRDIIGVFAQHRVAANLIMILMLAAGIWALSKLNTQFFPNFELDFVRVQVIWRGAAAEDVESAIVVPLERELRDLDGLRQLTSTSAPGVASLILEYDEGTDIGTALDEVKQRVDLVRDLPSTADEAEVSRIVRYEPIARVVVAITAPEREQAPPRDVSRADYSELRHLARSFERELLSRGIARIDITGLPEEEIAIQVSTGVLQELGMSLPEIAERLSRLSRDLPAGVVGRNDVARQLRSLDQRRDVAGFAGLPVKAGRDGSLIALGDVATIERRPKPGEVRVTFLGRPAVELRAQRTEASDALGAARILSAWVDETRPLLPPSIELHVFDESWRFIKDRLFLLLKNGAGGLILVVTILFLFLNGRVAWWVAVGIPVSFMGTLAILYAVGGSINMISLFALIMALGIIVDDAIVVGEDALAHYQSGEAALEAAEGGARRMLAPVLASSLTTVAAFLPLMLVGGVIGNIMFDIPLVIVCVILASLVESFLVLPGHLRQSFRKLGHTQPGYVRLRLDEGFVRFRDGIFRRLATRAIEYRWTTLASAIAMLILTAGLLAGGRIGFNFFPSPEGAALYASASFVAGTSPDRVRMFMEHLQDTLEATEVELLRSEPAERDTDAGAKGLVKAAETRYGAAQLAGVGGAFGDQHASIIVELVQPAFRSVRLSEFIKAWRSKVRKPAGLETLSIFARVGGPPGRDVDIRLTGSSTERLKFAALELAQALSTFPGVSAIEDDMPYGKEQLVYRLTPTGQSMGLTVEDIGRQLRAAYDGQLVQIFQIENEEVEVRVMLPDSERHRLTSLDSFNVMLPGGSAVPLVNVVDLQARRGFETLRHAQGRLAVQVSADVDAALNQSNRIVASLERDVLPSLKARYGVDYSLQGRSADQEETLADMRRGALIALFLIYVILTWVFASYGWPLVVMTAIPFGAVGAVVGHWLLGIDLTVLSLFGVFGLSGIVINDSIILVTFYKHLRAAGVSTGEALIDAACQRLRAVLLTSLTTIAGLLPLLFETSLQAQFLIPMAVSISFGLGFATLLVLFFVPALLSVHESVVARLWPGARTLGGFPIP